MLKTNEDHPGQRYFATEGKKKNNSIRYVEFAANEFDLLVNHLYYIVWFAKKAASGRNTVYKCPKCKDNKSLIQQPCETLCIGCASAQIKTIFEDQDASKDDDSQDSSEDMNCYLKVKSPLFTSYDSPYEFEQEEDFTFDTNRNKWNFREYPFWALFDLSSLCDDENWEESLIKKITKAKVCVCNKQANKRELKRALRQNMRDGSNLQKKQKTEDLSDGKLCRCTLYN